MALMAGGCHPSWWHLAILGYWCWLGAGSGPPNLGTKTTKFFSEVFLRFPINRGSRKWMGQALLKTVDWWLGCIWGHDVELESLGWLHHGCRSSELLLLEGWEVVYIVISQEFNYSYFCVQIWCLHNLLVPCAAFGFGGLFGINAEISRDHR